MQKLNYMYRRVLILARLFELNFMRVIHNRMQSMIAFNSKEHSVMSSYI